ncbi:diguanylate cyclase domain-containing protein [Parafrankia sp. FMc2]|uniref:diguanylate cyclase domain-containing protein n=1 Tax=Parafrankia sp. FMc2 TaxID=3233196 RepID=UPI0034D4C339
MDRSRRPRGAARQETARQRAARPCADPPGRRLFRWAAAGCAALMCAAGILVCVLRGPAGVDVARPFAAAGLSLAGLACMITGAPRHGPDRRWRLMVSIMMFAAAIAVFPHRLAPLTAVCLVALVVGGAGMLAYPVHSTDDAGTADVPETPAPVRPPTGSGATAEAAGADLPAADGSPTDGARDPPACQAWQADPVDPVDPVDPPGHASYWYLIMLLDCLIMVGCIALLAGPAILRSARQNDVPLMNGPTYSIILAAIALLITVALLLVAVFRQPQNHRGRRLLRAGMAAFLVAAVWHGLLAVCGATSVPAAASLPMVAGALFTGLAALCPDPPPASAPSPAEAEADRHLITARLRRWHTLLPYVPLTAAAAATLTTFTVDRIGHLREMWALLGLLLLALARQMLTMAENARLLGEVELQEQLLRFQAFHDSLTGLANRNLFTDRLQTALHQQPGGSAHSDRRVAVLFCDLNDFKHVNDLLGHAAGDDLLRITAGRLSAGVRASDTVARLGGDEFAILLGADSARDPTSVGLRLVEAAREPVRLAGVSYAAALSVGLVTVDPATEAVSAEDLLHRADLAMYAAKAQRSGSPAVYTPALDSPG